MLKLQTLKSAILEKEKKSVAFALSHVIERDTERQRERVLNYWRLSKTPATQFSGRLCFSHSDVYCLDLLSCVFAPWSPGGHTNVIPLHVGAIDFSWEGELIRGEQKSSEKQALISHSHPQCDAPDVFCRRVIEAAGCAGMLCQLKAPVFRPGPLENTQRPT